jgi:hypothetical protein
MEIIFILLLCCCFAFLIILLVLFVAGYIIFNNLKLRTLLLAGSVKELFSNYSIELFRRDFGKLVKKLFKSLKPKKKTTTKDEVVDAEFEEME